MDFKLQVAMQVIVTQSLYFFSKESRQCVDRSRIKHEFLLQKVCGKLFLLPDISLSILSPPFLQSFNKQATKQPIWQMNALQTYPLAR